MKLVHLLDYRPLGTRTMDDFILEYARQAAGRGWKCLFGFSANPPPEFDAKLRQCGTAWFTVPMPFTANSARHVRDTLTNRNTPAMHDKSTTRDEPAMHATSVLGDTHTLDDTLASHDKPTRHAPPALDDVPSTHDKPATHHTHTMLATPAFGDIHAIHDTPAMRDWLATDGPPPVLVTSFLSVFQRPLLWLKQRGVVRRLVVIDHSSGEGPSPRGPLALLRRARGAWVGRIVDRVVCVSDFIARRDVQRVFLPAEKVCVVPNGIELARFPFAPAEGRPRQVAFAGQLIPAKGVPVLLAAMRRLNDPSVECLIAGEGPERAAWERQSPPRVRWVGRVANIAEFFRQAAVVVVPSQWAEAFGLVAIEAMASGAAVIVSDAGALPEVAADGGLVVPTGDDAALAAAIQRLLASEADRARLALRARQRVEAHYQLGNCVQRHLEIIESWK